MNTTPSPVQAMTGDRKTTFPVLDRMGRRVLFSALGRLQGGGLEVVDVQGGRRFGETGTPAPVIQVQSSSFYRRAAFGGSLGAADSYIRGEWTCNDLTALIRLLIRNMELADGLERAAAWLTAPLTRTAHWLRRNSRRGSKRNIREHYDLGNDLFELMLDPTMMYSCGVFESETSTLQEASVAKIDRICRKLRLKPSDHVGEIGTGWGGFALHAAKEYGCRVTTTTISAAQKRLAEERIAAAGLQDRVTVVNQDYRDMQGSFDKLVSIEMIEAVGHEYLPPYFSSCAKLLKPDGQMLLQAITMRDQRYSQYLRSVDFIKKYVFPGCCVPSFTAICNAVTRGSDLRISHVEDLTPHYARTLREWRLNVNANRETIRSLGYSEQFLRMWEFYLCYCEAGFAEHYTGDLQILLNKPQCRAEPLLPDSAAF